MQELIKRYPALADCREEIKKSAEILVNTYKNGGKVITCGNGGSSADADHIVGELMKGFLKKRPLSEIEKLEMKKNFPDIDDEILTSLQSGLPAVSLGSQNALNTAFMNDVNPEFVFAQGVLGLGKKGDTLIAISTSGNAKNVNAAVEVAKALGITVIGLTGMMGGNLKSLADVTITVPETETYKVQELHLPVYHYLCATTEAYFFSE